MRGFEQLEQADVFFGFLAWCARLEFFRAFDVRLRGTAIAILHKIVAYFITNGMIFSKLNKNLCTNPLKNQVVCANAYLSRSAKGKWMISAGSVGFSSGFKNFFIFSLSGHFPSEHSVKRGVCNKIVSRTCSAIS